MAIIDFHTHILPGIDDGSRDVHTSLILLEEETRQGIDIVVVTPHFYASHISVEDYLKRRQKSYDKLMAEIERSKAEDEVQYPKILVGAEVTYFEGMSRADKLSELVLEGTNILLLEMPFKSWSQTEVDEVMHMINDSDYKIMLAHIERFLRFKGNKQYIQAFLETDAIIQCNSDSLNVKKYAKWMLKSMKKGMVPVMGSDCHDTHYRVPTLLQGRNMIASKLDADVLQKIDQLGEDILK